MLERTVDRMKDETWLEGVEGASGHPGFQTIPVNALVGSPIKRYRKGTASLV
jgi:hypothetical protein